MAALPGFAVQAYSLRRCVLLLEYKSPEQVLILAQLPPPGLSDLFSPEFAREGAVQ